MASLGLAGRATLLERELELSRAGELIVAARAGAGHLFVIEGRSGMGKTALLGQVQSTAQNAGMVTLAAQGSDLEREFAYGVVRQLLEPAVARLTHDERSRLFAGAAEWAAPVLGQAGRQPEPTPFAALQGLYWLVADLAARRPLLLAVDDAHWADVQSLRWLGFLQNRLADAPILIVVATRPAGNDAPGEELKGLMAMAGAEVVGLRALGERSVATLLQAGLAAEPSTGFTSACARATAGNPLALSVLIRDLADAQVVPDEAAAAVDKRAPNAIVRSVEARLARSDVAAKRFAQCLAVMGDGAELHLIAGLAETSRASAVALADDLVAVDLLAWERPLRFAHPLLRAAVYERIPLASRSELHRRAADALAAAGKDPEAVAAHLLMSEPAGEASAVARLRQAAAAALRRAVPGTAIAYLRRALAEPPDDEDRPALMFELGYAELVARDPGAVEHLEEALQASVDPVARARIWNHLADAVLFTGDEARSFALRAAALDEVVGKDPSLAAQLEATMAGQAVYTALGERYSDDPITRLRALAAAPTDAARAARLGLGLLLALRGPTWREVLPLIESGLDGGAFLARETADALPLAWALFALVFVDELARACALASDMLAEVSTRGSVVGFGIASTGRAFAEFRAGSLAEAEADARPTFELAVQHALVFGIPYVASCLGGILLERGRLGEAATVVESVDLGSISRGGPGEPTLLEMRGRVRCATGRVELGIADLRACGETVVARMGPSPMVFQWRSLLALALARTAPDEARELVSRELELARRTGLPRAIGIALRASAALEEATDSVDLINESVAILRGSPAVLELAKSEADLGAALRRRGHLVEARVPLREAFEIASHCGAMPLVERTRTELAMAGLRPRRPATTGVEALTPGELRVARLAAQEMSNRDIAQALFITTKTVKDHLGSAYRKLEIGSRHELARVIAGRLVAAR